MIQHLIEIMCVIRRVTRRVLQRMTEVLMSWLSLSMGRQRKRTWGRKGEMQVSQFQRRTQEQQPTTCFFGHKSVTKGNSTFSPKDGSCWTVSHFKSINPVISKQFSNLRHLVCKRQNTYLKFLKNAISKHNFWKVHVNWPMREQALVI